MDTTLRILNIVLGVAGSVVVFMLAVKTARNNGERFRMFGGAALCLFVATGTLGVMLGYDTVWRLPFLLVALAYILIGGIAELVHLRKRR